MRKHTAMNFLLIPISKNEFISLRSHHFHFTLLDVGCFEKIAIIATSIFGSGNSITDADDSRGDKEAA